jgi:putative ABC transport system substrate-binding protein
VTLPELARLGFIEGRNLLLDVRAGSPVEAPRLARELVAPEPDVITAVASNPIDAAREATAAIPIFMMGAGSLMRDSGPLVSRQGANVTGVVILQAEPDVKRFELLDEVASGASQIAVLLDPRVPWHQARQQEPRETAAQKSVELLIVEATGSESYSAAFAALREAGAQALRVGSHPSSQSHRR